MKFGYFDDLNREYVIETPATPLPWINYLGTESFFGLISNTGGGYCFYRDSRLRRLIRYRYNNIPADIGGRFYYLKEADQDAWSPAFHPTDTPLDAYKCRHGLGYTVFESARKGLCAELTFFIPMGENCELHLLTLKNTTRKAKNIQLYGAVEWCLWDAADDSANFQRNLNIGEVEVENNTVYHKTEYRERRDHYAYYGVNAAIAGFDTDRDTFLGPFKTWSAPDAVVNGKSFSSVAHGWSPIGALRLEAMLEPGEEKTFIFTLGYAQNPKDQKFIAANVIRKDEAVRTLKKFADHAAVKTALAKLASYWKDLLGCFQIKSGDEKLDRMVNIWNPYQCMVTFNMSRSASYFESGTSRGIGFRDSCQDLLGFVHLIPERARERILDLAGIQRDDGSTYHQYQPLTGRGNNDVGSGFNDDPLWLVACTSAYIRETGDFSILDAPVPFDNTAGSEQPLMEHLRRSMRYTIGHKGRHGLPLIGRADWNDCLNLNCFSQEPGESFQTCSNLDSGIAESVFIAGMFVKYGREYAKLCEKRGLAAEAEEILCESADMERAVIADGWDGSWFLRAYDAFGSKVGSRECTEGKIFIEPQGLCIMADIGLSDGKAKQALDSVREQLLGAYGAELLHPCYTEYRKELGEITSYPPGYKENGSVFCHNNPWVSIAETRLGRGANAFDLYSKICPAYLEDKSEIRKTEPYVYAQTAAGRSSFCEGEAKNSWLTGTAAWAFVSISQYILGILPTIGGLTIRPCVPLELNSFEVVRRWRGAEYKISVQQTGSYSLTVNGRRLEGDTIPFDPNIKSYLAEVTV